MTKDIKLSNGNTYKFPLNWNSDKINNFLKQDFKVCPYCSKVDIRLSHLNDSRGFNNNYDDNNWK
jgi:hypothetical protein